MALPAMAALALAGCAGAGGGGGGGGEGEGDSINVLMVGNPQMVDIEKLRTPSRRTPGSPSTTRSFPRTSCATE
jgi:sorbitol/mannitol transport system substrate-binding protein